MGVCLPQIQFVPESKWLTTTSLGNKHGRPERDIDEPGYHKVSGAVVRLYMSQPGCDEIEFSCRNVLYRRVYEATSDLMLVENFR
jgi:hypothetical protein